MLQKGFITAILEDMVLEPAWNSGGGRTRARRASGHGGNRQDKRKRLQSCALGTMDGERTSSELWEEGVQVSSIPLQRHPGRCAGGLLVWERRMKKT